MKKIIEQMERARVELLALGDLLIAYPDKQTEARGAAKILEDWKEGIAK